MAVLAQRSLDVIVETTRGLPLPSIENEDCKAILTCSGPVAQAIASKMYSLASLPPSIADLKAAAHGRPFVAARVNRPQAVLRQINRS